MIKSEYVRNLNRNYERVLLDGQTDCKRYQYCILVRGGIKYLLPCMHKQIDDREYLYYDISSSQSVWQMFEKRTVSKEWMKDFLWSIQRLRQELNRFLLDDRNVIWNPTHIFQDLEKNDFCYMYLPYYGQQGENKEEFGVVLEFLVDKIDYEDEELVSFVYHAYEQFQSVGYGYLDKQLFEDFNKMCVQKLKNAAQGAEKEVLKDSGEIAIEDKVKEEKEEKEEKRGFFAKLSRTCRRNDTKDLYREELRQIVNGYAVCEEFAYGESKTSEKTMEEFGKTIYIEEVVETNHGLYTEKGEMLLRFDKFPYVLGKRKEDVDYVLGDYSASRVHARFLEEKDGIYLEDLNSTNGTFKNGLRMQPYEKRKLEKNDEIRFGKSTFVYK